VLNRGECAELHRLRAEIQNLKSAPVRGTAWATWYRSVYEFLARVYGLESAELAEFQAIRFESAQVFGHAEDRLRSMGLSIEIPEERYYLERLPSVPIMMRHLPRP
jgi:hypothetical protein